MSSRSQDNDESTRADWRGETRKTEELRVQRRTARWSFMKSAIHRAGLTIGYATRRRSSLRVYSPHHVLMFTLYYAAVCGHRPLSLDWWGRLSPQAETCPKHSDLACNHEHRFTRRLTVIVIIIVIIRFSANYFSWLSPRTLNALIPLYPFVTPILLYPSLYEIVFENWLSLIKFFLIELR